MFERIKGNLFFEKFLKRPDIDRAYAMVEPTDSWYDTITTVHNSLAEIQKLPHEVLEITSHDGLKLKAIYYPAQSNKTAIWIHGYTSHAERESAFPALFYRSLGYGVLVPYQRAHGISEGKYIAFGALEYRDMMLWVDKINTLYPNGSIVIHGLSMGGGIALDLATQDMENVKCMIVDAPSTSIENFFRYVTMDVYKKHADKICKHTIVRFNKEFSTDVTTFDRVKNIANGKYPLLLSAGSNENMEEILLEIQQKNPKETKVLILPGCNHGNGMYKQTELYQSVIREFIEMR